jgi:hypothetical protein
MSMTESEHLHLLATLALAAGDRRAGADEHLSTLNPSQWKELSSLASPEEAIISTMKSLFGASIEKPSWSDRVAKKINFGYPA